ncbi:MAG: putative surface protein with fasciclin (FAS1) repeats, partial [Porticoccaceae bacterium]
MIKKYFALSVIAASVAIAGCSSDDNTPAVVAFVATPGVGGSSYDFIVLSEDHTTLEVAINAAGLADTLDNPANAFTIFAPNNSAFTALDADGDETTLTTAELIEPANLAALVRILQYHVLGSDLTAAAIAQLITDAGGDPAVRNTLLVDASVAQT